MSEATATEALPTPGRLVGARVLRTNDPRLLSAGGRYLDDIDVEGMLHAVIVRSPEAHGRIVGFDASAALALDGVVDVLGPEVVAASTEELKCVWIQPGQKRESYPIVPEVVRHVGEAIGIVVARSRAIAEDAAELIDVEIDPLDAVVEGRAALAEGAPLLFPEWGTNEVARIEVGDPADEVEAAVAAAPTVVRRRLEVQRQTGMPIEPRGLVARYDKLSEELFVWMSSQAPHHVRDHLGHSLRMPVDKIRVVVPDVGGGFGTKEHMYPDEALVCLAALRLGRTVKWVQDRREALISDNQEREHFVDARMALDRDGKILAIAADAVADLGAYPTNVGAGPPLTAAMMIEGQYKVPLCRVVSRVAVTNKTPLGAQRGFGMPVANWVLERLVDESARELGIEPAELRRRNLIGPDEFPHTTRTGMVYDSGEYEQALDRALSMARRDDPPEDGRRRGVGIGAFVEFAGLGPVKDQQAVNFQLGGYETAVMRMEADGTLTVLSGVMGMGQGIETTLAQIAADAFNLPIESVNVVLGDTGRVPYSAAGSIASRSIAVGGSAMHRAGEELRAKVLAIAAHQLEADVDDLELAEGAVRVRGVPGSALPLATIANGANLGWDLPEGVEPTLEAKSIFDPLGITYGYATNVAAIAVDPDTGEIEIEAFVTVHDCGRIINPMIVDGQIHGALANGIGTALLESLVYDEYGQPRSTTFMDYLLPSSAEIPDFAVEHTETLSPHTPNGAKGVGEGGTIGAPAAIGNALADAIPEIAERITATPLSPARVWEMCRDAGLHST